MRSMALFYNDEIMYMAAKSKGFFIYSKLKGLKYVLDVLNAALGVFSNVSIYLSFKGTWNSHNGVNKFF